MQRLSFGQVKPVLDGKKYQWTGKKMKDQNGLQKSYIINYCQLCHEMDVNGCLCLILGTRIYIS